MDIKVIADRMYQPFRPIKACSYGNERGKLPKTSKSTQTTCAHNQKSKTEEILFVNNIGKNAYWEMLKDEGLEDMETELSRDLEMTRNIMFLMTKRMREQEKLIEGLKKKLKRR